MGIDIKTLPPERALIGMRIMWLALILGPLVFLAELVFFILPQHLPVHPQRLFVWVNLILLLTIPPITFLVRALIFRFAKVEGRIPARAYSTGNLIFWAGCESVAFSGLIFALLNGSLWPTIIFVAIAILLQVITFPVASWLYFPS